MGNSMCHLCNLSTGVTDKQTDRRDRWTVKLTDRWTNGWKQMDWRRGGPCYRDPPSHKPSISHTDTNTHMHMHTQKHLLLYFGSCHGEVNDLCVYLWTNFPPTFFSSSFFSRLNSNAIKQIMKNNMNQYILSFRLRYKDRQANRQAGKQTDRQREKPTNR